MTTAFTVVVVLFLASCSKSDAEQIGAVEDRKATPQLRATDVTTLISDSGITRYRISAAQWDVYDKAEEPYWEFPKGIYLDRFDQDLSIDASIESDYAKYLEKPQIWELRKNVKATNLQGERFESELIYWDQKKERIYSDTAIVVHRAKYTINAMGFESDQTLTNYDFYKITGRIYIDPDDLEESNDSLNSATSISTLPSEPPSDKLTENPKTTLAAEENESAAEKRENDILEKQILQERPIKKQ